MDKVLASDESAAMQPEPAAGRRTGPQQFLNRLTAEVACRDRLVRVRHQAGGVALLLLTFLAVNCISIAAIERSSGIQHTNLIDAFAGMLLVACSVPLF